MNVQPLRLLAVFAAVQITVPCWGALRQAEIPPAGSPTLNPKVRIETTLGDIVVQLYGEKPWAQRPVDEARRALEALSPRVDTEPQ